ncbi:MAG: hypothetical protein Kow0040_17330 [Thermogutta sp.]
MSLYNPSQRDGLFDVLGRLFFAAQSHVGTSAAESALRAAAASIGNSLTPSPESLAQTLEIAADAAGSARASQIRSVFAGARAAVRAWAEGETGRSVGLAEALERLREAMESGGYYLTPSQVSVGVSADAGNLGEAVLLVQTLAHDGLPAPDWLPQTLTVRSATDLAAEVPARRETDHPLWPGGSGSADPPRVLPLLPEQTILRNDALAPGAADPVRDWIVVGAGLSTVAPPQDEIRFTAEPTGGYFRLAAVNHRGTSRTGGNLAWNASPEQVAQALRSLDYEFESAQVSRRSDGPGYVVDWVRGRPDLAVPSVESQLTGATASITRVRAGTPGAFAGYAAKITGDGTAAPGIFQRIPGASRDRAASLIVRAWHDGATAGTLQIGLFADASTSAAAVTGPNGAPNTASFNLSGLSAGTYHLLTCPLAIPAGAAPYVGLRMTAPLDSGKSLALSWPRLIVWTRHTERPDWVLLPERFGVYAGDAWTVSVANDMGGDLLTWWVRCFGAAVLPPRAGTTLIPDSVIQG